MMRNNIINLRDPYSREYTVHHPHSIPRYDNDWHRYDLLVSIF